MRWLENGLWPFSGRKETISRLDRNMINTNLCPENRTLATASRARYGTCFKKKGSQLDSR